MDPLVVISGPGVDVLIGLSGIFGELPTTPLLVIVARSVPGVWIGTGAAAGLAAWFVQRGRPVEPRVPAPALPEHP